MGSVQLWVARRDCRTLRSSELNLAVRPELALGSRFLNLHILPSQGPRYPPNTLSLHISRARKRIPRLDPCTLNMRTLDSSMSSLDAWEAGGGPVQAPAGLRLELK